MKNKRSKFLSEELLSNRIGLDNVIGGAAGNNSDVTYNDSKRDGGGYDIAVLSLIDTVDSTNSLDKPS